MKTIVLLVILVSSVYSQDFLEGTQQNANFGMAVSSAGDVNGDGYADVLVGSKNYSNDQEYEGKAFLYYGSPNGIIANPVWEAEGNNVWAEFGNSLAYGDINADGYSDIIIGAHQYTNDQAYEGRVFVYYGSEEGIQDDYTTVEQERDNVLFGYSVACGDVNNDGYDDVIVGCPLYNNTGKVFVFVGDKDGVSTESAFELMGITNSYFGISVSTVPAHPKTDEGSKIIVGAKNYKFPPIYFGQGCVFVYAEDNLKWQSPNINTWFTYVGYSVSNAGDVNGDGYNEIIYGAIGYDAGSFQDAGKVFIYSDNLEQAFEGDQAFQRLGNAVSSGDFNNDGYGDVIVGAYLYNGTNSPYSGKAAIYTGSRNGLVYYKDIIGSQSGESLGYSVASCDINADGFSDIIVGSPGYGGWLGRVYIYYGLKAVSGPTPIDETQVNPENFVLDQNYPNPFNPSTTIKYSIPSVTLSGVEGSLVTLKVFDVLGNEVASLVDEYKPAGSYEVEFSAKGLTSGIYFYKLQAGSFVETKKMILMK